MDDKIPKVLMDNIVKSDFHKPGHASLVLDFSGIPAADSRTVFCAFVRYIEASDITGLTVKLLSSNAASLMFPVTQRRDVEGVVHQLNKLLLSHRYGKIDTRYFNLDGSGHEFAQCCAHYLIRGSQASIEAFRAFYQQPPSGMDQLAELIDLERIVGQADMSMHLRRQTIWLMVKNRQPAVFGEEIWVSIAAMEEITGKNIVQNDWMFARFTELLDNRVLSHLSVDKTLWEKQLCVNLNPVAILSDNFQKVIKSLSYRRLEKLTIEIGLTAWQQNRDLVTKTLENYKSQGIGVALDGISVSQIDAMQNEDLDLFDFLKVHVSPLEGADLQEELAKCTPEMRERIICTRCETLDQIEVAINAGIQRLQGYGLAEFVKDDSVLDRVLGAVKSPEPEPEPEPENLDEDEQQ